MDSGHARSGDIPGGHRNPLSQWLAAGEFLRLRASRTRLFYADAMRYDASAASTLFSSSSATPSPNLSIWSRYSLMVSRS